MYTLTELLKLKKDELLEIAEELTIKDVDEDSTRPFIADKIMRAQREKEKQEKAEKSKKEEVKMPDLKKEEEKKPATAPKPAEKPAAPAPAVPKKKKYTWL